MRDLIKPSGFFFSMAALSTAEALGPLFAAGTFPQHHCLIATTLDLKTQLAWICFRELQSGAITNRQMISLSAVLVSACSIRSLH